MDGLHRSCGYWKTALSQPCQTGKISGRFSRPPGEGRVRRFSAVWGLAIVAGLVAGADAAELDPGIVARFATLSMSVPTIGRVVICHGFGCQRRTEIGLSRADHAKLAQLMAPGRA